MLNFCDFIQVYVFSTNHHLNNENRTFLSFINYHCSKKLFKFYLFYYSFCPLQKQDIGITFLVLSLM